MKLVATFITGIFILFAFWSGAQSDSLECENLKFKAGKSISRDNLKTAVSYLLKAEKQCDTDRSDWEKLINCLQSVIGEEYHQELKSKYIDTLLHVWDRQEKLGVYNQFDDLARATMYAQNTPPNYESADFLFQRGIKLHGSQTHESYIVYAMYTTYVLLTEAEGEKKAQYKTRTFQDYFNYIDISVHSSRQVQATLDQYLEYVFPDCNSILPEVSNYLDSLPKDTTLALHRVQQMENLLDKKNCTKNVIYDNLIETWLKLDSTSIQAQYIQDRNSRTAEEWVSPMIEKTDDPELKAKLQYKKAYIQYSAGKYLQAHASGKACTGEYKSKGLLIAAQSVAATATSCGDSTFDRKCNYLYAAQLAEEAGEDELAGRYRSKGPETNCTTELVPIELSCWGVTVKVCQ